MVRLLGALILFIGFIYLTVKLFYYFSYWGLGLSIILLAAILVIIFVSLIVSLALYYKKEIFLIVQHVASKITSTKTWRSFNQAIRKRCPLLYQFTINRFKKDKTLGLYFTVGFSISFIFLLLFLGIIQDFVFKDSLVLADLRIIYLFRPIASANLNHFFAFFTVLGNWQTIILLFAALAIFQLVSKNYRRIIYLGASIGAGSVFSYITKFIFHRPRPPLVSLIKQPISYGLPSGHALLAVCFYGFIAYLLIKYFKKIYAKVLIAFFSLILIILIGLSRVYLGVHYLSDVLAGWYLGFFALILALTFFEINGKFYVREKKAVKDRVVFKYVMAAALFIFAVYFINNSYKSIEFVEPHEVFIETNISDFIKRASLYSENLLGQKMEPVSFVVAGDEEVLKQIFARAGWEKAEAPSIKNILKISSAIAKNLSYPNAPMTPSFYNNKTNDLGFEKPVEPNTARQRHHTRYWKTGYQVGAKDIWVATASFDEGVEIGAIIQLPTHKIDPDIDKEREFIMNDLKKTNLITAYQKINLVGKTSGINAAGDSFFTDGQAYLVYPAPRE